MANDIKTKKIEIGNEECVATYVKDEIAKVDVSEQLKEYALKTELPSIEGLATEELTLSNCVTREDS